MPGLVGSLSLIPASEPGLRGEPGDRRSSDAIETPETGVSERPVVGVVVVAGEGVYAESGVMGVPSVAEEPAGVDAEESSIGFDMIDQPCFLAVYELSA